MNDLTQRELARLSGLIDLIYQGATDLETWRRVPSQIGAWMQSSTCIIFTPVHPPDNGGFMVTHNLSPQTMALWVTKYHAHDIWAQRGIARGLAVTGNVLRDQDLVSEEEFLSSTMWREFLAPVDIGRMVSGVIFSGEDNGNVPVVCTCNRPFATPFQAQDADKLRLLLPHLSRALGVMFRLRDAEFKVSTSLATLDRLPNGALLIGGHGAVTFANQAARHLLASRDGLRLQAHTGSAGAFDLMAADSSAQCALEAAIREAVAPDILSTRHFSKVLAVPRPSGRPPYALNFSSLPSANEFGLGVDTPRAIVFLSDRSAPVPLDAGLLRTSYGLTAAEIRLVALVVEGATVADIASRLAVSANTVKTQLKQLYAKTNTNNRAKLVRLLLSLNA